MRLVLFLCVAVMASAGSASATHNHPAKAKQLKLSLVSAYDTCAFANTTHKPALATFACTPPVPSTNNNPANKVTFGSKGAFSATIGVGAGDIKLSAKGSDILDNGTPFTGTLTGVATMRWTDHGCEAPSFTTPCTIYDLPFPVPVSCTDGKCAIKTTVNTVAPGTITAGDEGNIEIGQFVVNDPDGDPAFRQGVFVP